MPPEVSGIESPDLYTLCGQLNKKGADDNSIGKLYVISVINAGRNSAVSVDSAINNDLKKEFQKKIRSNLGRVIFELTHQGYSIDSILESSKIKARLIPVGNSENVGNALYQLVIVRKYGLIGIAVVKGAKKYRQKIPRGMVGFDYNLEIEYDLVRREIENKLSEV